MIRIVALALALFLVSQGLAFAEDDPPNPARLSEVDYYLRKIETKAKQARGVSFQLHAEDQRTLRWIMELAEKYPDHERVKDIVERARVAYNASKGLHFQITPEMIAYRDRDAKMADRAGAATDEAWAALRAQIAAAGSAVEAPFPAPDPFEVGPEALTGKTVVLEDVHYEERLFVQNGINWVAVGSPAEGHYFLQVSGRAFNALYEALQRYVRTVSADVLQAWTFVGRVTDVHLLAPDTHGERTGTAQPGWIVEPTAILLPGKTLVQLDEAHESGARFSGEEELQSMRAKLYTVRAVPEGATPEQLVEVLITALKEKNWDLYLDCLHPDLYQRGGNQLEGLRYNWDLCQKGLANLHAHAEVDRVEEIRVVRGRSESTADLEDFFGDKPEASEAPRPEGPLVERVTVWVSLYDLRGMQTVAPRAVTLERTDRGRWHVVYGATLTF